MIGHSIVIASAKGGAGKTSVAVNLASLVAASGWRVLAVDLDGQASLTLDLGLAGSSCSDDGQGLLEAAVGETAPSVVDLSDHLSIVPAGTATFQLANMLAASPDPHTICGVARALTRVADPFDLVVIDTPPTAASRIVDAGLAAGHYLLIPTPPDPASLNGIHLTASAFASARQHLNPALRLLGVVLFRIPVAATAIRAEARAELEAALGSAVPVYSAVIREALRAAVDQRRFALTADDYRRAASRVNPSFARRRGMENSMADAPSSFSRAAGGLAEDYRQLVREVMADYLAAEALTPVPGPTELVSVG